MVPPACLVCGDLMEACNPMKRVHRACFVSWKGRADYTRARFEDVLRSMPRKGEGAPRWASAVLHRTERLACILGVLAKADEGGRPSLEITLDLWHVSALDPVFLRLREYGAWISREPPIFGRSGHPDDLALYARELDELRSAWPDESAIRSSAVFAGLAADVSGAP